MSMHAWRIEETPEQIRKLLHLDTNFAQFTIYKHLQFTKAIKQSSQIFDIPDFVPETFKWDPPPVTLFSIL